MSFQEFNTTWHFLGRKGVLYVSSNAVVPCLSLVLKRMVVLRKQGVVGVLSNALPPSCDVVIMSVWEKGPLMRGSSG